MRAATIRSRKYAFIRLIYGLPFLATSMATAATQDYRNSAAPPRRPQPMVIEIEYDTDEKGAPRVANIKEWSGDDPPAEIARPARESTLSESAPETDDPREHSYQDEPDSTHRPHRVDSLHYTITLPPAWEPMSDAELAQCNQLARGILGTNHADYHAGFRRRQSLPGTYPYILAQSRDSNFKSYEEIERGLAAELPGAVKRAEGELRDLASDFSVGSAVLDRNRNRLAMRMQLDVRGAGTVDVLSVGHLTKNKTVFLHCYAQATNFAEWLPAFEQINDSFQFDDGHEFVAATTPRTAAKQLDLPTSSWVLVCILSVGGGVLLGLFATMLMRLRRGRSRDAILLHPMQNDAAGSLH